MTKEQKNKYMKQYYLDNPEKRKEHDRKAYKKFKSKYVENAARWRRENPEKYQTCVKKFYKRNPEATRKYRLKADYNLTIEQFNQMLSSQSGLCLVCSKKPAYILSIDHNHTTGQVRGLVCQRCNLAIGVVEQPNLIQQVNTYLARFH